MLFPAQLFIGLAFVVALTAAAIDLGTGQIPNWLTIGALCMGLALRLVAGAAMGLDGIRSAAIFVLAGVVLCSSVPLLLWRFAGMGGGDLKLLAALGAISGPLTGFRAQTYAFVAMFVYVLGRLVYEGKLLQLLFRVLCALIWPLRARRARVAPERIEPIRFGPAILVGVCLALLADWKVI
jgi:prepilin peptidase CpaA